VIDHVYAHHSGEQAVAMLGELADAYDEIRAGKAEYNHEIFGREQFISRTTQQAAREEFDLLTVRSAGRLAGFSFGYRFGPNLWWANAPHPSSEVLAATKIAVIELNVLPHYRGQGWGRTLMEELLADRPEEYATLAVIRNSAAQDMYRRWGWGIAGAFDDEPPMDVMVKSLLPPGVPG
jgi:ribosomal protein S18 acetylase RimI-like enzyme